MSFYSKLEAINTMLLESGEHIVNDLSSDQGVDTSVAQFILEQTVKSVVTRGLANNRFTLKLTPDTNGKLFLPDMTCYAQAVEPLFHPDTGALMNTSLVTQPTRLFNTTTQSDVFLTALSVDIIVSLTWEELEANLQKSVMTSAARDYQRITQGDPSIDRALAEKEIKAVSRGRAADIHKKQRSLLGRISFNERNPRLG